MGAGVNVAARVEVGVGPVGEGGTTVLEGMGVTRLTSTTSTCPGRMLFASLMLLSFRIASVVLLNLRAIDPTVSPTCTV